MSRPVNTSDSLSFVPTGYSDITFTASYYQNPDNGLSGSDNTTNYAAFAMRNTSYHIYYDFSVSGIPSSATITSVTCSVKGYVYSSSYYPSVRLYSGTTAKGSASNITSTSASNVQNITAGTWTVSELENARLYIVVAARYSRGSLSNSFFRFYGATLTVNYSLSGTEYEVSISNTSDSVTTQPSTTQYVFQGGSQEITITTSDINSISVTDNNVDVTSSIIQHSIPSSSDTLTFVPSGYTNETNTTNSGSYPYTNAYKAPTTSGSSYARWEVAANASFSIYYTFSITGIPSNATITSVQVEAALRYSSQSVSGSFTEDVQLYNGTTPMGEPLHFVTNGNSDIAMSLQTINNTGSWTPQTLQNLRFVMSGSNGATSARRIYLNGVTLTISYEVSSGEYYYTYTISNISADHAIIIADAVTYFTFTCTDNSNNGNITPTGTQNIEEGQNVVYTLTASDFSLIKLTDNNVDVTSQIVYSSTTSSGSPMFIPSDFINDDFTLEISAGVTNGYTDTSSDTYCRLNTTPRTTGASGMFIISVTGIPSGAIIDSVSCKVKGRKMGSDTNILSTAQLYSGNTAKGSAYTFTGAYTTHMADLDAGTWTVEELQNVGIKIISTVNSSSGSAWSFDFFGAEFTVNYHTTQGYTYNILNASAAHTLELVDFNESLYLKVNGQFVKCNKIYKKINNVWTEVNLNTLTDPGIYIKK